MPWKVEIDYFGVGNPAFQEVGLVRAEYNPPGPGPERFVFKRIMQRADINNPSSPKRIDFIADAIAASSNWTTGLDWSDSDSGALKNDLDAATP